MQDVRIFKETLLNKNGVYGMVLAPESIEQDMKQIDQFYESQAVTPQQTHSTNVDIVRDKSEKFPETDALITFLTDTPIGIRTADCVPLIIFAPDIKAVAAIHAGWKGTLNGIVDKTIDRLESFGAKTSEMIVAFGPSISKEKYEVDQSLADLFKDKGFTDFISYPNGPENKPHLDLQGINRERLLRRGVTSDNIRLSSFCTFSSLNTNNEPLFQSYRRDGESAGRNLTVITMRQ